MLRFPTTMKYLIKYDYIYKLKKQIKLKDNK